MTWRTALGFLRVLWPIWKSIEEDEERLYLLHFCRIADKILCSTAFADKAKAFEKNFAVTVITIHVSGSGFDAVGRVAEFDVNVCEIQSAFMICIYNSISRFAVPSFIMLSGAFVLDNKKNEQN